MLVPSYANAQEALNNSLGDKLRYAALHDCESRWKTCGGPKKVIMHMMIAWLEIRCNIREIH